MKNLRLLVIVIGLLLLMGGMSGLVDDAQAYLAAMNATRTTSALDEPAGFVPYLEVVPAALPVRQSPQTEFDSKNILLAETDRLMNKPDLQIEAESESESEPDPDPEPQPALPVVPERLVIPAIGLDAPIVPAQQRSVTLVDVDYYQWLAPDDSASGWHTNSARLGEAGNLVLNGHHNVYGEVFRDLENLNAGDRILVSGAGTVMEYEVANIMIVPERHQSVEQRIENARWIEPSDDTRLTLITCWPYESNTHRLILVARPVPPEELTRQAR